MDQIEKRIIETIDKNRETILSFARDIQNHPELGFEEERTAERVEKLFGRLGLEVKTGLARTGVRGDLPEKKGPNVTILGELDGILCRSHFLADPKTGAAHACGHHAQLAAMAGAAMALCEREVRASLDGNVTFFAVPAEEYVDAEKRKRMKARQIGFPASGKSELIRLGELDRSDIILTTHVHMIPCQETLYLGNTASNGFTAQVVTIHGKAAHAAINPWDGVNALSIAASAIEMMGLMRETFREQDHVRLHNVIRKAGDAINTVPEEAIVETKVRASSLEQIRLVREKIDRAYDGAAYAFGGTVTREILQGYMPVLFRPADQVLIDAARDLGIPPRLANAQDFNDACTDVGDLTHLFPVLNFTFGGTKGSLHGADFQVTDEETAYVIPAKMLALSVYKLLKDQAGEAEKIIRSYTPVFDRDSYIKYIKEQYHI